MVAPPGLAVTVQLLAGKLLRATLPVANAHVGEVIVPIVGVGVWFTVIVWVAVHPSSEYVIVCVPAPAVAGLNVLLLTPGPLQVPPATLAVSVRAAALWHIAALLLVIVRSPVLPKVNCVKALPPPSTQATSSVIIGPRNTYIDPPLRSIKQKTK